MTHTIRRYLSGAAMSALMLALPLAAAPASASLTQQETAEAPSESQRLNAWFEQIEQEDLERSPLMKAYRGIIDADYGQWGDVSHAFAEESFQISEARLAYMRENFDFDALDASAQLSWRLFEYRQHNARRNQPFSRHGYVFHQMSGMHANIPVFLTTIHRINSAETAQAWVSRAATVDEVMNTLIDEAETRFAMGIQPPAWMYDYIIETSQNVISGAPFDDGEANIVWESFERNIRQINISDADRARLLDEGRAALLSWVEPYQRLIATMESQREAAAPGDGVWRLPDGEAYYNARLANFTTTNLTAQEIHDLGVENVARIHREMEAIMAEVGFEGSLQDFFVFMRDDPQFYYPNTDEGRQAYLDEATRIIETINERLPEYFITLPQHALEVRRVEAFREASAGKAFYSRPAPDGSRPGIYYANLRDMNDMPIYQMEALAYHEGNPGHHMQLAIMTDLQDIPAFRRFGGFTAYSEGWGLYTEYLPLEMGFYEDPYSNFGRLAMELWRAARLVVDTGLHYKQWSREEAIAYLTENTPNSLGDATNAIERYIVMPGQATAYMIGMLKILELRERAETELGDRFDIRVFHEVILRDGAVPLEVLEELVDAWIAETLEA